LETSEAVAGRQPTEGCLRSDREYAPGHRRLTSRVQNRLKPTQAQTVISAAILRQLSTVMVPDRPGASDIAAPGVTRKPAVEAVAGVTRVGAQPTRS